MLNPSPSPTPIPDSGNSGDLVGSENKSNPSGLVDDSSDESAFSEGESETGGQSQSGQSGGASIETGNSTTSLVLTADANTNSAILSGNSGEANGATIVNSGNGSDSTNSGSLTLSQANNTLQGNSAKVVNNLSGVTTTGQNSTSGNTGADNSIITGDANTSGTVITSVNTNLVGVAVYEFNIIEDYNGDYVLDFSNANCISGCTAGSTSLIDTGNGADSTNTVHLDSTVNGTTFQQNDATIENNLTLASDSGNNEANRNTEGDNSIETGDANVSANVLTLANNNIAGGVIYGVVNIYGDLVGDIILPEADFIACCFIETTLQNTNNGFGSTNTLAVGQSTNNSSSQFNISEIENNLTLYANTGGNETSRNTNGDNSLETGEANIIANVVNFVNNNILGGDWWLVIVNEGGRWIGKIIGAGDSNIFGSQGFSVTTNANGEVTVTNSDNGSGTTNTQTVSLETNNTTNQLNSARIENNINLSANTGGNSASRNTGGNNSISTGDANIIANIVNFVNNNIIGGGRLFVTVINVFGSWVGDFIGPGYEKETDSTEGIGGVSDNQQNFTSDTAYLSTSQEVRGEESAVSAVPELPSLAENSGDSKIFPRLVRDSFAVTTSDDSSEGVDVLALAGTGGKEPTAGRKVIRVNLAWLLTLIPLGLVYLVGKRKLYGFRILPRATKANA